MNDPTVMGQLAELPGWLQAAGWGALSASGLLIGAVGGYYMSLQHTAIARTMTFAAGVLLAVVAVDLVINSLGAASPSSSARSFAERALSRLATIVWFSCTAMLRR